jgi:hypothetical protein
VNFNSLMCINCFMYECVYVYVCGMCSGIFIVWQTEGICKWENSVKQKYQLVGVFNSVVVTDC